jgi:hypothetical protein
VFEELRALGARMGEVTPMTAAQRKAIRGRLRTPDPILQASINVIGATDNVSQAVGQPAERVRALQEEANRWTAVEDELRKMLNGVTGANLIRRLRVDLIAAQAYTIGAQLARDPANAILVPHVQEIKRMKRFSRRKKGAQAAGTTVAEQPAEVPERPAIHGRKCSDFFRWRRQCVNVPYPQPGAEWPCLCSAQRWFFSPCAMRRRCGDAFDEQPQREHDLEYEGRQPLIVSGQWASGETGKLQG